jgi:hypothetical protein
VTRNNAAEALLSLSDGMPGEISEEENQNNDDGQNNNDNSD